MKDEKTEDEEQVEKEVEEEEEVEGKLKRRGAKGVFKWAGEMDCRRWRRGTDGMRQRKEV